MPTPPGPKFVLCYVCKGKFTEASLVIHEPQCIVKWKLENNKLPTAHRKPVPRKPEVAQASWELVTCVGCGRTFAADRLPVHQRVCKVDKTQDNDDSQPQKQGPDSPSGANVAPGSEASDTPITPGRTNAIPGKFQGPPNISSHREGPNTVVCYICGREFGTQSVSIHEPQCLQKWKAHNARLPKEYRRPLPKKPLGAVTKEQMTQAYRESSKAQLVPCGNCGRAFAPDRLSVHQMSCRPKGSSGPVKPKVAVVTQPPSTICYICGEKFGTKSITIHEPQCMKKWNTRNAKLPPAQRRPLPKEPSGRKTDASGKYDVDAMNDQAYETTKNNFVSCSNCGRTFNPGRLVVHQRSCRF